MDSAVDDAVAAPADSAESMIVGHAIMPTRCRTIIIWVIIYKQMVKDVDDLGGAEQGASHNVGPRRCRGA